MTTGKWWPPSETREEALREAAYYLWCGNVDAAFMMIVSLCLSVNKKGSDAYDESLEEKYITEYQKPTTTTNA